MLNPRSSDKQNTDQLLASIRQQVIGDIETDKDWRRPFLSSPFFKAEEEMKPAALVTHSQLSALNLSHPYSADALSGNHITSHRGFLGQLIVKLKRKVLSFFRDALFVEYFEKEREFQASLIRFLNDIGHYVDGRDSVLDRKINEFAVHAERLVDEQSAALYATEQRVAENFSTGLYAETVSKAASNAERIETLESVVKGLEHIAAKSKSLTPIKAAAEGSITEDGVAELQYEYLLLENRFRGKEDTISERVEIYPPLFANSPGTVLEIGSGRGELQEKFVAAGIKSYGVDIDTAMVKHASEKGLDARLGDGIAHLANLEDSSLGGVVATQVIEHLPLKQLRMLLDLARQKVAAGGVIAFETINSNSMVALTQHYFRDPTHVWPMHPETMKYMAELAGLKEVEVRLLSPFSDSVKFQAITPDEFTTPSMKSFMEQYNSNIEKLNQLMYGAQDYCLIAKVGS